MKNILLKSIFLIVFIWSCSDETNIADDSYQPIDPVVEVPNDVLPENPQVPGNASNGWDYLRYGGYSGTGIPIDLFNLVFPSSSTNNLTRDGVNQFLDESYVAFECNDKIFVGASCFACHSSSIDGEFVVGLGNTFRDYSTNQAAFLPLYNQVLERLYSTNSEEYKIGKQFSDGIKVTAPYIQTPFRGVNPAADLERAAAAHRGLNFEWKDNQQFNLPETVLASDVPAWWLFKKKNALYYNGMGRGDFSKLLMQISIVGIQDTIQGREIQKNFEDVVAFLNTVQAPAYTKDINTELANTGKALFNESCKGCHGTPENYANRLISIDKVKTDPYYAQRFYDNDELVKWVNNSWIGKSDRSGYGQPKLAYVAPPLDGVWATAPYLHNGSVPNLWTLLKSSERPTYWQRDFNSDAYDHNNIGTPYTEKHSATSTDTYNTTLLGYSNQGHTFGDKFTDQERKAVIEYLKTL